MGSFMGMFDYTKEGAGVGKDEKKKKRFFLFFDIYLRKFWRLLNLNVLYSLFFFPLIITLMNHSIFHPYVKFLLFFLSIIVVSVGTTGFVFVLRNFAIEKHSFVSADFIQKMLKNFKQGVSFGIINALVLLSLYYAVPLWYTQIDVSQFYYLPLGICICAAVVFLFMNFYIYLMIVTFKFKMRQILKNAFIFAIVGLKTNFITLLCLLLIIPYILLCIYIPLFLLLIPVILLSTFGLIIVFNSFPYLEKYIIIPYNKEHPEEAKLPGEAPVFSDDLTVSSKEDDN